MLGGEGLGWMGGAHTSRRRAWTVERSVGCLITCHRATEHPSRPHTPTHTHTHTHSKSNRHARGHCTNQPPKAFPQTEFRRCLGSVDCLTTCQSNCHARTHIERERARENERERERARESERHREREQQSRTRPVAVSPLASRHAHTRTCRRGHRTPHGAAYSQPSKRCRLSRVVRATRSCLPPLSRDSWYTKYQAPHHS